MKTSIKFFLLVFGISGCFQNALCQAPNISYSTPTNVYTVGTTISSLTPTNTGGAVPATTYATVSTLANSSSGLDNPRGLTTDGSGNIYEADFSGNEIKMISSSGTVTIIAGNGTASETDNPTGTSATFNKPSGIVYDGSAYLYVADRVGNTIRRISTTSPYAVVTIAGTGAAAESDNTTGILAQFSNPAAITYDGAGNLYVADFAGNRIRKISTTSPYAVVTIAGTNAAAEADNPTGTLAKFNNPSGIVYQSTGNLFVCDFTGNTIRQVSTTAPYAVTTFAGSGAAGATNATGTAATFTNPSGVTLDASGNLLITDEGNNLVRAITPAAVVTTLAGSGAMSDGNGVGVAAKFYSPYCLVADQSGNLFVGDDIGTTSTCRKILLTGYTISATVPAGLTFRVATGVIAGTPTATSPATNYTITAYNAFGSSSTVISIAVGTSVAWLGFTSPVWTDGTNWSTGTTPGASDAVTIGVSAYTGVQAEPAITTTQSVGSITFGNNGGNHTLTLTSPGTLTIAGFLTIPTTISTTIAGTGAISIAPGGILNVKGTGVLTLTAPVSFTLMSDATGSASVGQIKATSITGTGASAITVQRYLTGGVGYRGYRLLSSPVYATTVSPNKVYSINYLDNSVYLTGAVGGGFDQTGNPSIYLYREDQAPSNMTFTSGNFWGVSAINQTPAYNYSVTGGSTTATFNLPVGNGIMLFFRGDRSAASIATETQTTYIPTAVTLSTTGTLNAGNVVVHDWYTPSSASIGYTTATANAAVRGFNLVGNPYASSIDWSTFSNSVSTSPIYGLNVNPTTYILNPKTKNYDTYNAFTGITTGGASNIIPSGQGFFVQANAASPSLTFKENAKVNVQVSGSRLLMDRRVASFSPSIRSPYKSYLRLKMITDSVNNSEMVIGFNNISVTNYNGNEDAQLFGGASAAQSLAAITSDSIKASVKWLPYPKNNECLVTRLDVEAAVTGLYRFERTELKEIPQIFELWLVDAYKKDSVDIRKNESYAFNIDLTDTASFGNCRFKLVVRQNPALAFQLLDFAALKVVNGSEIVWTSENEQNYTKFAVERSTDGGKTFNMIDGLMSSAQSAYNFLDRNPANGENMYKLQITDLSGNITYSNVVTLMFGNLNNLAKTGIIVYPNPAKTTLNLSIGQGFNTTANGKISSSSPGYNIQITNALGSTIKQATTNQQSWQTDVSSFSPGTYVLQVISKKDNTVVGQSTFIKL